MKIRKIVRGYLRLLGLPARPLTYGEYMAHHYSFGPTLSRTIILFALLGIAVYAAH